MAASAPDPLRKDKPLRPLSSATDLTDFTHSTLEPDVCQTPARPRRAAMPAS